jgi:hypothetical protein
LLPRNFGILRSKKIALELEEVCIETDTLSFKDYLELRTVDFFVMLINNNRGFRPLLRLLKSSKVKILDLLLLMLTNLDSASSSVIELIHAFEYETENELFDSEDEARSFYTQPEVFSKLLEGEVGMNLVQSYTARTLTSVIEDLCQFAFSQSRILLEKQKPLTEVELQRFEEIKEYCKGVTHNLFGADRLEDAPEFDFHWNIKTWTNTNADLPLDRFKFQNATKIRFKLTEHQYKVVEDNLNRFGNTPHGRAKTLIRTSMDQFWRTPENMSC